MVFEKRKLAQSFRGGLLFLGLLLCCSKAGDLCGGNHIWTSWSQVRISEHFWKNGWIRIFEESGQNLFRERFFNGFIFLAHFIYFIIGLVLLTFEVCSGVRFSVSLIWNWIFYGSVVYILICLCKYLRIHVYIYKYVIYVYICFNCIIPLY